MDPWGWTDKLQRLFGQGAAESIKSSLSKSITSSSSRTTTQPRPAMVVPTGSRPLFGADQQDPELRHIAGYMSRKILDNPPPKPKPAALPSFGGGGSGGGMGGSLSALSQMSLAAAGNPYDRALKQLGIDYGANTKNTQLQGQRQDADLAALFGRLGNYTGAARKAAADQYSKAQGETKTNYDLTLRDIANSYKQSAGNTTEELQRLGIGEVSPSAMAGLARDSLQSLNRTRSDKVNATTLLGDQRHMLYGLMTELMGSAAAEGTSQRGRAKQSTTDALNALMQQYAKDKNELSGKKADALLQARMANMKASMAARAAASRSSSNMSPMDKIAYAVARQKALNALKPGKAPKGYLAAIQGLGGDQDLKNELDFLLQTDWSKSMDTKDDTPLEHLQNYWGSRTKYGQKGIDQLLAALNIAQGKA